jgi:hypothetical protein
MSFRGPVSTETDFVVAEGSTYYVVVKAIDHASNESQPSNESEVIVP